MKNLTSSNFLKKILGNTSSFLGPLIPLLWTFGDVSSGFQSQSGQPYSYLVEVICYTFPKIHLWYKTCQPLDGQHGSQAILLHVPATRHWWGPKPGSIIPLLPHSVRPGRHSTNWAMPARLTSSNLMIHRSDLCYKDRKLKLSALETFSCLVRRH